MKNYKVLISFVVLAIIMILLYPQERKFKYDYQNGRPWMHETLISPIDFPILKTEDELLKEREKKASEVIDYYILNDGIASEMIGEFNKSAISFQISDSLSQVINNCLADIYTQGVVSFFNGEDVNDKVIFVKKEKRVETVPAADVYDIPGAYSYIEGELKYSFPSHYVDSLVNLVNLKSFIAPNLIFDNKITEMLHKEAVDYISPTKGILYAGQLIVSKGEIVTAEISQLLESYRAEYRMSLGFTGTTTSLMLSHIIMILVILLLIVVTMYFTYFEIFSSINKLVFVLFVYFFCYLALVLLYKQSPQLLYIFPFSVFILYTTAFFENKLIIPLYIISLIPLALIPDDGVELLIMNLLSGFILLITFRRFNRGWLQFVNVIFIYAALLLVYISFELGIDVGSVNWSSPKVWYLAINAVASIVLYPFVFLFEKIFGLVSYTRLWELSDTNNRLLQELAHKAPGTLQHSIQVANLAEYAAKAIGANSMLVKVGSLYHDIGKIENPMCFIENQAPGVDYHKEFTAIESARLIIKHVEDGVAIATRNSIPNMVVDFIRTHHGHSKTMYFYNRYCNEGGDPSNLAPFTYDGGLPTTKEQAIVMMADAVEAASRTLKSYSYESISTLVESILAGRLSDEQLVNADISFREIGVVKESLKQYLMQVYHARIVYPKRKVK